MKGTKMKLKFKRILAALLAASAVSFNAFAFTPYGPESLKGEDAQTESKDKPAEENKTSSSSGIIQSFRPKDYQYRMFEQILDAYVENHLYEFTEEEVLHKFFEDFINENPMYFALVMEYMLGTMDPYSSYYKADSGFLEPDKGSTGFGFIIDDDEAGVYVKEVVEDSNAKEARFMAGDRFVSVAGINVENHTIDVVSAVLANPDKFITVPEADNASSESDGGDSSVEIVVDRNGEKLTFNLSKGPMTVSQISANVTDNNGKPTLYVQMSSFLGDNTDQKFNEIIRKHASEGIKHLTIDLRDNGGGSLDYAMAMAETFLDEGELISYYNDRKLEEPQAIYSTTPKASFDSITILINENTASAAELFTSILQDKGLAKVVGTKSYGKSLGQEVFTLANGDYITITTYQMLNESLKSYDGIGIIPDLAIENVEMCYTLPSVGVFNHQNYPEIKEGQYSDVTKALEDRMEIMGILRKEYCDGIFDDMTKTALYVLQKDHNMTASGYVDHETVSLITKLINSYKSYTYEDDSQTEVAMIVHHSFSQGKRLVAEKEKLREKQSKLIQERDEALDAARDAALEAKNNTENN